MKRQANVRQLDHFKNNPIEKLEKNSNITEGIYYCSQCDVVLSAYYPRTYSLNCVRSVNFGRCHYCNGLEIPKEKRLLEGDSCPDCCEIMPNNWEKICGEALCELDYEDFKKICQKSLQIKRPRLQISDIEIKFLFRHLSKNDFLSFSSKKQPGLDKEDLSKILNQCYEMFNREICGTPLRELTIQDFGKMAYRVMTEKGYQSPSKRLIENAFVELYNLSSNKTDNKNLAQKDLLSFLLSFSRVSRARPVKKSRG